MLSILVGCGNTASQCASLSPALETQYCPGKFVKELQGGKNRSPTVFQSLKIEFEYAYKAWTSFSISVVSV
jgi:hypothetical protein